MCTTAGSPGTWTKVGGSSGGGSLLGEAQFAPSTATTYTLSSQHFAAVDSTNLAVTFTAPSTGTVVVTSQLLIAPASGVAPLYMGLLSAGSVIGPTALVYSESSSSVSALLCRPSFVVSGLAAGSAYTFELAYSVTSSGSSATAYAGNAGGSTSAAPTLTCAPALLAVWA